MVNADEDEDDDKENDEDDEDDDEDEEDDDEYEEVQAACFAQNKPQQNIKHYKDNLI